jgi:hypothetical protein
MPFQPSLLLASKAGTYLSEASNAWGQGSWPHPQTLDLIGKACMEQTL